MIECTFLPSASEKLANIDKMWAIGKKSQQFKIIEITQICFLITMELS